MALATDMIDLRLMITAEGRGSFAWLFTCTCPLWQRHTISFCPLVCENHRAPNIHLRLYILSPFPQRFRGQSLSESFLLFIRRLEFAMKTLRQHRQHETPKATPVYICYSLLFPPEHEPLSEVNSGNLRVCTALIGIYLTLQIYRSNFYLAQHRDCSDKAPTL